MIWSWFPVWTSDLKIIKVDHKVNNLLYKTVKLFLEHEKDHRNLKYVACLHESLTGLLEHTEPTYSKYIHYWYLKHDNTGAFLTDADILSSPVYNGIM